MPGTQELNYSDALTGRVDTGIPVIEGRALLAHDWATLVPLALASAKQYGFLCVDLVPEQQQLVRASLERAIDFFALPEIEKAAVRDTGSESGWTPSYEEPAYQPGTVANVESFDIEKPLIDAPDDPHWPKVTGFRASAVDY